MILYFSIKRKKIFEAYSWLTSKISELSDKGLLKNYKETLACSVCGYSKKTHSNFCSRALEFHHNKKNKSFSVSNGVNRGRSKETVQKEIDKCIVVCSRCHAEIHASLK